MQMGLDCLGAAAGWVRQVGAVLDLEPYFNRTNPETLLVWCELDAGVCLLGFLAAVAWGKASGRMMDHQTVMMLGKLFGGLSLLVLAGLLVNMR
jgi:hypothetical protein